MAQKSFDLINQTDIEEIKNLLLADNDEDPVGTEDLEKESDIASEAEVEERKEDTYRTGLC